MSDQDGFIQSTSALFNAILPEVLTSLKSKVESDFNAYIAEVPIHTYQCTEQVSPPRPSAFADVRQWVNDFASFLRCEKYQVAIAQMQELLAVDAPKENEQGMLIHQDKVLGASFKFLVHAFVDFQTQQSPEDDIDQCVIQQLYQSMYDTDLSDRPAVFLKWSRQHEGQIMQMCLEQVRDSIKNALTQVVVPRK